MIPEKKRENERKSERFLRFPREKTTRDGTARVVFNNSFGDENQAAKK